MSSQTLRLPAEQIHAAELEVLSKGDERPRPPNWRLSPQSVVTYLLGGNASDGRPISSKYIGNRRLIETAVPTLATDRALLLLGLPGTAKSWVSEHLAAAISGSSQRITVQTGAVVRTPDVYHRSAIWIKALRATSCNP